MLKKLCFILVLIIGCKPMVEVEVKTNKENANFIIHWKPKSAKFNLYKISNTEELSNQKKPVDYKYEGSIVNENLLSNPMYLKLETGQSYIFTIEKPNYSNVEVEVNLKIGEVFNNKYELSNGIEKAKNPDERTL
jgi:hypothetical protein